MSARRTSLAASFAIVAALASRADASLIRLATTSATLAPGATATLRVELVATENFSLTSAGFAFTLDASRFVLDNVSIGSIFGSGATFNRGASSAGGQVNGGSGIAVAAGTTGTLATFTVRAQPTAPLGGGAFNLIPSAIVGGTTFTTQVNNGAVTLAPAATAGVDPTLDTTITVVPEPATLAAAVGAIALAAVRRRG